MKISSYRRLRYVLELRALLRAEARFLIRAKKHQGRYAKGVEEQFRYLDEAKRDLARRYAVENGNDA